MQSDVVNLAEKFRKFSEHWSPRVVAELNDYQFKLAKFQGDFVWHDHKDTDEVFLVVKGTMGIELRNGVVHLSEGEMYVVPKGVEHRCRRRSYKSLNHQNRLSPRPA
ncbi:cupin domain-containing protein [Halomonas organivorans]